MTATNPPSSIATPVLFGIPNCDQVKLARLWFSDHGIACHFHDFKKDGLTVAQIEEWLKLCTWDQLLNRKGTTWRKLPVDAHPHDVETAIALMLKQPSVIKRPVLVYRLAAARAGIAKTSKPVTCLDIGYSAALYTDLFL